MEKPNSSYIISTATDLDRNALISWRIPKQGTTPLMTKKKLVSFIEKELAAGNTKTAIQMLKDYLKDVDSSFDTPLKRLEKQIESNEIKKPISSQNTISSEDDIEPESVLRALLTDIPEKGNSIDLSRFGKIEDDLNLDSNSKKGKRR